MKKIPEPDLANVASILSPAEMNRIHFGGNHTPLSPDKLKEMAQTSGAEKTPDNSGPDGK